jgi:signal transduction histidine kinase
MEDLLALGRPIREENIHEISMVTLVENSLKTWLETQEPSKPSVKFLKPDAPEKCIIMADSAFMTQVIINLLENAHNHSQAESEIICSVYGQIDNKVIFSIKDRGPGIKEEILPRIFDPFFTTRKGGTGLGLSIVRQIVENHQGSVVAYNNTDGQGATFDVIIPVYIRK